MEPDAYRATSDLPTKDGPKELAALEAREPWPLPQRLFMPRKPYRAEPGGHVARDDLIRSAEACGFRFLGRYSFSGMWGSRPHREAWVDRHGMVRLSMRAERGGPIATQMSHYYLSTTFDDGSAIVTWSKSPAPLASAPRALSFGGTGELGADYERHLEAGRKRCAGRAALTVPDLETNMGLSTWFDSRLYPTGLVRASGYLNMATMGAFAVWLGMKVMHARGLEWAFRVTLALVLLSLLVSLAQNRHGRKRT